MKKLFDDLIFLQLGLLKSMMALGGGALAIGLLQYLIRDVIVAMAALDGALLWQISPQTNLVTAFVFGIIGTLGFWIFGRDIDPAH